MDRVRGKGESGIVRDGPRSIVAAAAQVATHTQILGKQLKEFPTFMIPTSPLISHLDSEPPRGRRGRIPSQDGNTSYKIESGAQVILSLTLQLAFFYFLSISRAHIFPPFSHSVSRAGREFMKTLPFGLNQDGKDTEPAPSRQQFRMEDLPRGFGFLDLRMTARTSVT